VLRIGGELEQAALRARLVAKLEHAAPGGFGPAPLTLLAAAGQGEEVRLLAGHPLRRTHDRAGGLGGGGGLLPGGEVTRGSDVLREEQGISLPPLLVSGTSPRFGVGVAVRRHEGGGALPVSQVGPGGLGLGGFGGSALLNGAGRLGEDDL